MKAGRAVIAWMSLIALMAGCGPDEPTAVDPPTASPTAVPAVTLTALSTATPVPTVTPSPVPTDTPVPSATPSPTSTPTSVPPTATPEPVLQSGWTSFTTADGLASNYVSSAAMAPGGVLWFGVAGGISRLEHHFAVVFRQHQFALQHVDEFIFLFVPVPQRRGLPRHQGPPEAHHEVRQVPGLRRLR